MPHCFVLIFLPIWKANLIRNRKLGVLPSSWSSAFPVGGSVAPLWILSRHDCARFCPFCMKTPHQTFFFFFSCPPLFFLAGTQANHPPPLSKPLPRRGRWKTVTPSPSLNEKLRVPTAVAFLRRISAFSLRCSCSPISASCECLALWRQRKTEIERREWEKRGIDGIVGEEWKNERGGGGFESQQQNESAEKRVDVREGFYWAKRWLPCLVPGGERAPPHRLHHCCFHNRMPRQQLSSSHTQRKRETQPGRHRLQRNIWKRLKVFNGGKKKKKKNQAFYRFVFFFKQKVSKFNSNWEKY